MSPSSAAWCNGVAASCCEGVDEGRSGQNLAESDLFSGTGRNHGTRERNTGRGKGTDAGGNERKRGCARARHACIGRVSAPWVAPARDVGSRAGAGPPPRRG